MNDDRSIRYARVQALLRETIGPETSRHDRLVQVVDALWAEFGAHRPISWVGYYELRGEEMILGPRRDKPACSPIGMHGVCGQAAMAGRSFLVPDVRALGEAYIACDPRDLAELVVPVRDFAGCVVGVLDLDSHTLEAFTGADQRAIEVLVDEFLRTAT